MYELLQHRKCPSSNNPPTAVFWSWFPVSACGVRTVLLFVSSLAIFVLRVSQMHIGPRNTHSSLSTFRHIFPVQVFQTFGWYIFFRMVVYGDLSLVLRS